MHMVMHSEILPHQNSRALDNPFTRKLGILKPESPPTQRSELFPASWDAVTVVWIPPRTLKSPTTVMAFGWTA